MNEILSRKTLIYHILRKKVSCVSLTVDSGPTYKPAVEMMPNYPDNYYNVVDL